MNHYTPKQIRDRIASYNDLIEKEMIFMLECQEHMREYIKDRQVWEDLLKEGYDEAILKCKIYELMQTIRGF